MTKIAVIFLAGAFLLDMTVGALITERKTTVSMTDDTPGPSVFISTTDGSLPSIRGTFCVAPCKRLIPVDAKMNVIELRADKKDAP